MKKKLIHMAAVVLLGGGAAFAQASATLFEDAFNDLGKWTPVQGAAPALAVEDAEAPHAPYMKLANGVARADLARPIGGDVTLGVKMLHTAYARGLWVALFNADGTEGYGFLWDSNLQEQHAGQGTVSLRKFSLAAEPAWKDQGEKISPIAGSGHVAVRRPFASIQLVWSRAGRTLRLTVDGETKAVAEDVDLSGFSRVYIRGTRDGLFDDVTVTEGPPAEAGN